MREGGRGQEGGSSDARGLESLEGAHLEDGGPAKDVRLVRRDLDAVGRAALVLELLELPEQPRAGRHDRAPRSLGVKPYLPRGAV